MGYLVEMEEYLKIRKWKCLGPQRQQHGGDTMPCHAMPCDTGTPAASQCSNTMMTMLTNTRPRSMLFAAARFSFNSSATLLLLHFNNELLYYYMNSEQCDA